MNTTKIVKLQTGTQLAPPFLAANAIAKSYGGVAALKGVSLQIAPGEVHGLVGANGAGKSTFIKILAGLVRPDGGTVSVEGHDAEIHSPDQATALGMSFIHQELAFVPGMTVLENLMLGVPKPQRFGMVDWAAVERTVAPLVKQLGIRSDLHAPVRGLSAAENWLISICRALVRKARLIVMDEPTASLSDAESERLFAIIRDLSASGVAVLYVSHRLDEILGLCDSVTVFRDGQLAASFGRADLTRDRLVKAIVGHDTEETPVLTAAVLGEKPMLSVANLRRLPAVRDISFSVHAGEVLGLGGLVGAGRTELARLIFGAEHVESGTMVLDGAAYKPRSPVQAVKAGIGYVPEERRADGLLLTKSIAFNLSLANLDKVIFAPMWPLVSGKARSNLAVETIRTLAIKAAGPNQPVGRLSGGNQQKVVIGRWLNRKPKLLILDEPTRGVDIGARAEIHRLVREMARNGMAVIAISSEPDELPELCDRVLVMAEGRIVKELKGADVTRMAIIGASYSGMVPAT
ncbi:MAG: sugar ABC transporter ATP-binding protein [Cypionkella sp.]